MKMKPMTINLDVEKIRSLDRASNTLDISRSRLVSMLLEDSMKKLNNYLDQDIRNFYIIQFMRENITEEVLFDVFPRENAFEIIEGVKLGEIGAKKTLEMLSRV